MNSDTEADGLVTIIVDGESVDVDGETTGAELKQMIGASEQAMLSYRANAKTMRLLDEERVLNHIKPGKEVTSEPGPLEGSEPG